MARPCGTCNHVRRSEIDCALESGQTIRAVAARFGVSRSALHRHASHLLRAAPPQTNEPVGQEERLAQSLGTADVVPAVLSPPAPIPEPPEPESPSRLTTLSGQPEPEVPSQPAVAQEQPALVKYTGGTLGPCPVCTSKSWRLLADDNVSCATCHPMPPGGAFAPAGHIGEQRGEAMLANNVPATRTRVPVALSTL